MRRGIKRSALFNDDEGKSPERKKPPTEITSFDSSQKNNDKFKEPVETISQKVSSPVLSDLAKIIELRSKVSYEDELRDVVKNEQYKVPSTPTTEDTTLHKQGKEWLLSMGWNFDANPQTPVQIISQRPQFLGLGAKVRDDDEGGGVPLVIFLERVSRSMKCLRQSEYNKVNMHISSRGFMLA